MSKLFCLSPGLRILERQMQQPPGYRPRGYGICIIEEMDWKSRGNYSEIVDCVISRMQLEHLKKRVEEIFTEVDKELIFRSMKHRNDFYSLLMGKRSKTLQHTPSYAAVVFLLSADEAIGTIAKELHLSVSTVKRAISDLEENGFIRKKQRWRDNGGRSSLLFEIIRQAQRGYCVGQVDYGMVHHDLCRELLHFKD